MHFLLCYSQVQPKVLSISSSSSYVMNATTTCMQFLGHQSDIADGSLRHDWEFRQFNNIVGDYYVAPRFLDAIAMHIVKNFLLDQGSFDAVTRVPLILGIWGGKGQGKSFQTELAFKKLGVEAVVMSAGELESERAGEPGKMIRERYRKAAEMSRVRGRLSCLLINDLDAGVGRFENTQVGAREQLHLTRHLCDLVCLHEIKIAGTLGV
jgi:AAA+ superfamily predicted ATPase